MSESIELTALKRLEKAVLLVLMPSMKKIRKGGAGILYLRKLSNITANVGVAIFSSRMSRFYNQMNTSKNILKIEHPTPEILLNGGMLHFLRCQEEKAIVDDIGWYQFFKGIRDC